MEGWMHRYGRRRIGRSFFHRRYFVLESQNLAYYKRKPSENGRLQVPLKFLNIDGNCRVEDRGLETHHGHAVYVLSVYNKKERAHRITMAAPNIEEASKWKEVLEHVIEQVNTGSLRIGGQSDSQPKNICETERTASSSDHESQGTAQDDDDETDKKSGPRKGPFSPGHPDAALDWSISEENRKAELAHGARKHWRLVRCQNGLRFFEEIPDVLAVPNGVATVASQSRYKAMKAVGVVEASSSDIFELIMNMDETRYEWDASYHHGSLVQQIDGHRSIYHHRLELDWFPTFIWPRDLCYLRYWRRNEDGSYVILYRSVQHTNCPEQPGCVRAHMESGGYNISPLKPRPGSGEPRARVQHLVQIDLKGWGVGLLPFCHQHTVIQMLNSVAGLREWFSEGQVPPPMPRVVKMPTEVEPRKGRKRSVLKPSVSMDAISAAAERHLESLLDESDDDEDDSIPLPDDFPSIEKPKQNEFSEETSPEPLLPLDLSTVSGTLKKGHVETGRNCWSIPSGNLFRVRSKRFLVDRSKCPAGEPLMELLAVDWFKDTKRIDHVARRKGSVATVVGEKSLFTVAFNVQVPAGSTHYSMVFYFVAVKPVVKGSLLHRFVEGDDSYRNSRLKLIPSVPKGSWIVRQSVGSTPCILGKAVDCTYYSGPNYLEVDVDIGSSTVANGVLGLVFGVVTSLVVDMAFLVQGNSTEELPEHLIGAVRVSQLELSAAVALPPEDS
ncbi:hypothetical protein R1flu_028069 [Riccia fluitans]|uniref:START domain-containing protein n=1 Tax=Riccia fluitans TaxID=41844 RepID=A0ABD1XNF9_9MARC